jgi:hypothetical protein
MFKKIYSNNKFVKLEPVDGLPWTWRGENFAVVVQWDPAVLQEYSLHQVSKAAISTRKSVLYISTEFLFSILKRHSHEKS